MLSEILAFVALINPFALFLYLDSVRRDLSFAKFTYVIFKASVISFAVSILFFIAGDYILREIFNINFNSFRIFGGIVIFTSAYLFVVKGGGALIHYKDDLDDLASDIALPFMVGAGTISLSILMSQNMGLASGMITHLIIFGIVFFTIVILAFLRAQFDKRKFRVAFDKNLSVLLRLSGFILGSIGVDMILSGILAFFS